VAAADNRALQHNLLQSHAAGVGNSMWTDQVRAMMVARANVLATGATGAQLRTLETLIAMLNRGVTPLVPERGSAGDLAPLAHMALPMIGLGQAWFEDVLYPGEEAMARAGIALPELAGRDGLALINGTEQTTGVGALAALSARGVIAAADVAAAMTMEALGALGDSFDERLAMMKPHPGLVATSTNLTRLTVGSQTMGASRGERLRDTISLRAIPQVHGATRDALADANRALEIEINSVNDNPILGLADGFITSNSANFHGQRAGEALDQLATSLTSLATISERRSARLLDPAHNGGLPAFLIHPDAPAGINSGLMIAQHTAAALVAELRTRAVPASIQSIPSGSGTWDHVAMAPIAARRAAFAADSVADVIAIELLLAAQAIDLRGIAPAPALRQPFEAIRTHVPVLVEDRVISDEIAKVRGLLDGGVFT
jgi:histidine ammonia-lyase